MSLDAAFENRAEKARRMTLQERWLEVCRLTNLKRQRIMDDLREAHPFTSEIELKCMFAYEWLGEELARKFWPHYLKGIAEGRISISSPA